MSDLEEKISTRIDAKIDIVSAIHKVTRTPRTVYDCKIVLDSWKNNDGYPRPVTFDAKDILETLEESCAGNAYITDPLMIRALRNLGVISHGGSPRNGQTASKGENYDLFMTMLRQKVRSLDETRMDRFIEWFRRR